MLVWVRLDAEGGEEIDPALDLGRLHAGCDARSSAYCTRWQSRFTSRISAGISGVPRPQSAAVTFSRSSALMLMLGIVLGCRPVLSLFLSIHAGNLMDRLGAR